MLLGNLFRAYAKSRSAWFASALEASHFASKLMQPHLHALYCRCTGATQFFTDCLRQHPVVLDLLIRANAQD